MSLLPTSISVQMAFSARNGWYLASAGAILYCVNQWLGARSITWPTALMTLAMLFLVAIAAIEVRARRYMPMVFFLAVIGFPEYSANPYDTNYVAPFGLAKFAALGSLILMSQLAPSRAGVLFIGLIVAATAAAALSDRMGNVWGEVWYVMLIILALNAHRRSFCADAAQLTLSALERVFYLLIPIAIFTYATGLHDERAGMTIVYFYGHWVGIATAFAIYSLAGRQASVFGHWSVRICLLISTVYVCIASYQSSHFVLFIIAVLIAMFHREHRRFNALLPLALLATLLSAGTFVLLQGETDGWLYLKISQVFLLFSGGFIEASNSVTIRASQLISLFEQGSIWSILFGRGVASIYLAEGAFWDLVVFHDATFPESEITSGRLQYIHEPVVMLIKWVGVVGFVVALVALLRLTKSISLELPLAWLVVVVYLLFFASSLHTAILVTGIFILFLRQNNVPIESDRRILG